MDQIDNYIKKNSPKSAVIAGGGFIGLEMAEALVKRGIAVHIVEKAPHVMSVMDGEISGFIEEELKSYDVKIHKNVGVSSIQNNQVTLENNQEISCEMVLLSIGVKPTLTLAQNAGLKLGEAGGLLVNNLLQTSDPHIFAAGDMVEIEHKIHKAKVRIPLAGPANRQGRIVAENALGGKHPYQGSLGTSIVRVFDAVAGITGLSLKAAKAAGIDAQAITAHKEHHTSYYPGAKQVTLRIIFERNTGKILGGQTAGYAGADRRLDVIAMAAFTGMTVHDLADVDLAYSPPLGTANDVVNMAAYVAQNQISGYSPSISCEEVDEFVDEHRPIVIDVRDTFAFKKAHMVGANHVPLEFIKEVIPQIPANKTVLIYDETGKKGHQALRILIDNYEGKVFNLSGGYTSLQRYAHTTEFKNCKIELLPTVKKSIIADDEVIDETEAAQEIQDSGPLIVDVRTPGEFSGGAYPAAINIPLDELQYRIEELGAKDREITLYCASGARSGYALQVLKQMGFSNVTNGGGLVHMMRRNQ